MPLSLEDRMFGRLGQLTPEKEADVRTYYAMLKAQQDHIWAGKRAKDTN